MNVKCLIPLVSLSLGAASMPLLAREPSRNLKDLSALESKVEAVARKVVPATVALLSERTGSSGSGVIASEDGLILTAAHVVQGADQLLVVFPDGKQVQGKVLGANYSKDIAMVKITEPAKWPFVTMGASKPLAAGDWVIALGHSAGFDAGPHAAGALRPRDFQRSGQFPDHRLHADRRRLGRSLVRFGRQTHRHPLLHRQSLTNNNHAGIDGFREDWDRILAGETWGALSMNPFANPEMPVLGIGMAMMRGIKGVIVESVVTGSPAAAAGVRTGDVIRSLDGSAIRNGGELLQILAKRQAGDQVKLGDPARPGAPGNQGAAQTPQRTFRTTLNRLINMKPSLIPVLGLVLWQSVAVAQDDIPMLRPEERQAVDTQTDEFNQALTPILKTAAKSTVRVWAGNRRLAYGTVIGDGHKILTKWSEVARAAGNLAHRGGRRRGAGSGSDRGLRGRGPRRAGNPRPGADPSAMVEGKPATRRVPCRAATGWPAGGLRHRERAGAEFARHRPSLSRGHRHAWISPDPA